MQGNKVKEPISVKKNEHSWVIWVCLFIISLVFPHACLEATFYGESPKPGLHQQQFGSAQYYIYLPAAYNQEKQYPLVVVSFMYVGETEIDPQTFMEHWISLADQRNYIVIMPMVGGDISFTDAWYKDLLQGILEFYPIDSSRILLTGFGAGAHYALHFGASYPELFRAVSSVAGTFEGYWKERTRFKKQNRPDFYFLSGSEDRKVPSKEVRQTAQWMEQEGYSVRFEELKGIGHSYSDDVAVKIANWFDSLPKR